MRDFRPDKETSFRSFAELCVTRQIITAIKTATRYKHSPLNSYVSFSHTPAGQDSDGDCTLGDALPGPHVNDPAVRVISTEELQSLVGCLGTTLSPLESDALRLYLEGSSYEKMAEELGCDTKTIDNALQRVKRKILNHQRERQVSARRSAVRTLTPIRWRDAGVAQLAEHRSCKADAVGSSPTSGFPRPACARRRGSRPAAGSPAARAGRPSAGRSCTTGCRRS